MEHIVLSYENRVATIELNRPNALNALHEQMLTELLQALKEVEASEADIVIIRGRGKGFSAGGDIKTMLQSTNEHSFIEVMETIKQIAMTLHQLPKLTISYIHGAAAGLGFSLALACDHVIANEQARVAMNFIGIGLVPDGGGHFFLNRKIGDVKSKQIIWEGKIMSAQEAYEVGLVDEIGDEQAIQHKVNEWLAKPIRAMIATKQLYARLSEQQLFNTLQMETAYQAEMRKTKDHEEGIRAFLEKRRPHFSGK
ncbi:enoyl-CoA hydratase [Anoxybacillus flavithermus]|nr:enoyl-CoA hydratase [Anoxybacillus flavithermus]MBE2908363.1 enoyl-CoA hydratase [Anoxybacillus flavithermus]MBE2910707.1 enoyl-CoA hydratase [Anoxybacillus flavithermus]MBE2913050.1 enoyl-CoA hydratase [Anoxybacillus flavithermus]MBE2916105.1 enoyl-CoA hydratase [Anoxybacillus flavithermus]